MLASECEGKSAASCLASEASALVHSQLHAEMQLNVQGCGQLPKGLSRYGQAPERFVQLVRRFLGAFYMGARRLAGRQV